MARDNLILIIDLLSIGESKDKVALSNLFVKILWIIVWIPDNLPIYLSPLNAASPMFSILLPSEKPYTQDGCITSSCNAL